MSDDTTTPPSVEAGPEPASPLPWRSVLKAGDWAPWDYVVEDDRGQRVAPDVTRDAAAIVHRVNNWDALVAERDQLRAERDEAVAAAEKLREALRRVSSVKGPDASYRELTMRDILRAALKETDHE